MVKRVTATPNPKVVATPDASSEDFLARGLRSGEQARREGSYVDAKAVIAKLEAKLNATRDAQGGRDMDCGSSPQ